MVLQQYSGQAPSDSQQPGKTLDFKTETVQNNNHFSQVETIYGLPELGNDNFIGKEGTLSNNLYKDFNPYDRVLQLIPGDMKYNNANTILNAWDFVPKTSEFFSDLGSVLSFAGIGGGSLPNPPIKFWLIDINHGESLSNQYGDNILSSVNNLMSNLTGDYMYMAGGNIDTVKQMLGNNLESIFGKEGANLIKSKLGAITDFTNKTMQKVLGTDFNQLMNNSPVMKDLISGYKVDLPKTWKNSTINKQIGGRIRLMSSVDNTQALIDRILIPYAVMLTLSSPRSTDKYLYKWPYVVKTKLPGYADVDLAVITDLQIIKGADNIFSFDGKYLCLDLNVTIMPLYNTQFLAKGSVPEGMLTVQKEVKMLADYFKFQRI